MTIPPLSFGLENTRWVADRRDQMFSRLFCRNSNLKVIEGLDLVVQSMYKNELAIISIKVNNRSIDIRQSQLGTKQSLSSSSQIYIYSPPLLTETWVGSRTSRGTLGSPTSLGCFTLRSRRRWQR